jgi:hypothetical protein
VTSASSAVSTAVVSTYDGESSKLLVAVEETRNRTYLEFGVVLQFLGKVVIDSGLGLEGGIQLGLLVVGDRPGEGAVERVGICDRPDQPGGVRGMHRKLTLESHELVLTLVHLVGGEHEVDERDLDTADEIIGGDD